MHKLFRVLEGTNATQSMRAVFTFRWRSLTPLWDDLQVQAMWAEHEFTRANYHGQLIPLLLGGYIDLVVDKTELWAIT